MKKITFTFLLCLLWGIVLNTNAQNYIKLDASFYSNVLDEVRYIDIYLPADYYVNPEQYYATIYCLHGANGNQNSGSTDAIWYYNLHAENTTISSPPAIFVCPDGSCDPYGGSCWMNSELYGPYEDYFIQDVIGFIESNFRAYPDKNFRLITGLSMGGYGSARFSVNYPDMFRACVPSIGFLSIPDTLLNAWKDLYYLENGSYAPTLSNGSNTQLLLTMCGGLSPNLSTPPCYVDFPFDTLGNMVDTVLTRWRQNDLSKKVTDLPDEHELSWFMICGTLDYMVTHPTYLAFTDSLDFYEIGYDYNYFEGGHIFHPESWMMAIHWMDSIINLEYQTMGIKIHQDKYIPFTVYPVPAHDNINITYRLQIPGLVIIDIYDQQGNLAKRILNRKLSQGEHTIDSYIGNLPAGVYFIRIQTNNAEGFRKIVKGI